MHYRDQGRDAGCGSTIFTLMTVLGVMALGVILCLGNSAFAQTNGSGGLVLVAVALFLAVGVVMAIGALITITSTHSIRLDETPTIVNVYPRGDDDDDKPRRDYEKI